MFVTYKKQPREDKNSFSTKGQTKKKKEELTCAQFSFLPCILDGDLSQKPINYIDQ